MVARVHEGVEQSHLGIGLGGQPEQQAVHAGGVEVVEQQAHAHAAPGGVAQFAQQQAAGLVVAELVGLHVERGPGAADELQPRIERERGLISGRMLDSPSGGESRLAAAWPSGVAAEAGMAIEGGPSGRRGGRPAQPVSTSTTSASAGRAARETTRRGA